MTAARHQDEFRLIDDGAVGLAFPLDGLEVNQLLPRDDVTFDNPIDRAAVEQLVGTLRRHARDVLQQKRLALLFLLLEPGILPTRQVGKRVRPDGELDQMKRHAAFSRAKRMTTVPSATWSPAETPTD